MAGSPVLAAGALILVADQVSNSCDCPYLLKNGGLLTVIHPDTGELLRQDRVAAAEGNFFASPVAADGKLFLLNESGKLAVLSAGRDWRVLSVNDLGENCYATPAIAGGTLVVRSDHTLWAFRNQSRPR